jgi:hypothetical protein
LDLFEIVFIHRREAPKRSSGGDGVFGCINRRADLILVMKEDTVIEQGADRISDEIRTGDEECPEWVSRSIARLLEMSRIQ